MALDARCPIRFLAGALIVVALAACGTIAARDDRVGARIPDDLRRPFAPAPGDQTHEGLFPEDARAVPLSSLPIEAPDWPPTARYDFDSCQVVAEAVTFDTVRLYGRDLDGFRDLLFPDPPHFSCPPDQCFLRVNTAHVGRTVTITEDGIPCDDPRVTTLGQCGVGLINRDAINTVLSYRGNVIIADRIRVSGRIRLGYLALVLVAREEIQFLPGAEILGAQMLAPAVSQFGGQARVQASGATVQTCVGIDPATHLRVEGDYEMRRYTGFEMGDPGESSAGNVAPALVMISPRIRGEGTIAVHGFPGGRGTNGVDPECQVDDQICFASLDRLRQAQPPVGADGAPGGAGGPGGTVIIRTSSRLPSSIQRSVDGGVGGAGGDPGYLQRFSDCAPRLHQRVEALGVAGAAGATGPAGRILIDELGDQYASYAYLFGRRGAERHMTNALYHSRAVRDAATARKAADNFAIVDRNYCHVVGPLIVLRPPPPAPPLFSAATEERRVRLCDEVGTRQRWVSEGINFFGFPREFFMYTRPDILDDFRTGALDVMDSFYTTFRSTIEHESQTVDATSLQQQADAIVTEKIRGANIARLRRDLLLQRVVISVDRMKRNAESLRTMESDLSRLQYRLEPMLEPQECDFFCVLGDILTFVGAVVDLVASIGTGIDKMVSFFEGPAGIGLDALKEKFDEIRSLYPTPYIDTSDEDVAAHWAALVVTEVESIPGLLDTGSAAFDAAKKISPVKNAFETLDATLSGPPVSPLQTLAVVWAKNRRAERDLLSALEQVNGGLGRLQVDQVPVKDRAGAVGILLQMRDLVLQRIELTRESQSLAEDNVLASLESKIAGEELTLAAVTLGNATDHARRLGCRTGAVTGAACAGILPLATAHQLRDVRDDVCRIARGANDTVLLFDYLYQRARDFVDLSDRAAAGDPAAIASHDLRRNFLNPRDRQALARAVTDSLTADFIDVLRPLADGVHRDGFCRPGTLCTFASSADAATNQRVIDELLADGRVQFAIGVPVPERQRQRVTHFDLRLHAPPPYRLGCDDLHPCPATTPADLPFGHRYEYDYNHDAVATFEMSDGALRDYNFTAAYPRAACEIAQARLGPSTLRWDCRALTAFAGGGAHESVVANQLASSYDIERRNYTADPNIFGTSIRGVWTVDIRRTLGYLNFDDGCYQLGPASPLPSACLPSRCLSPCFDVGGNRRSAQSGAPAFCGCYDAAGVLIDTTSPGCSATLPTQLTFVLPDGDLAEACRIGASATAYERVCTPYVRLGQLQTHGDGQCCTEAGLLKPGLTTAERQACEGRGLDADTACRTPDLCYEICGPRCKAFKEAFAGFEYRIYWRAR